MKQMYLALVSFLLISSMMSPVGSEYSTDQDQLDITATTSIVADLVRAIGGDQVSITTLIGAGVDPHDFEPKPSDISTINNSDYIFWIGAGAEETLDDLLQFWEDEGKSTPLISAVNETDLLGGEEHEHEDEEEELVDPHFWMDPVLWKHAGSQIAHDLGILLPEEQSTFDSNLGSYQEQLDDLHDSIRSSVATIDPDDRFLVTQHDSFSYYTHRYNFTGKSLQGISTEAEAGIQEIDVLAQYIVDNDIHVVFTESTTPSEDMQAVLDAVRARGHTVAVGGQLFAGSVGSTSETDTYTEMMLYNTETIVSAISNPPTSSSESAAIPVLTIPITVALIVLHKRRRYA